MFTGLGNAPPMHPIARMRTCWKPQVETPTTSTATDKKAVAVLSNLVPNYLLLVVIEEKMSIEHPVMHARAGYGCFIIQSCVIMCPSEQAVSAHSLDTPITNKVLPALHGSNQALALPATACCCGNPTQHLQSFCTYRMIAATCKRHPFLLSSCNQRCHLPRMPGHNQQAPNNSQSAPPNGSLWAAKFPVI